MSLESWKKEFYPVAASEEHSDVEAIKHGILKWTGYSRESLEKHTLNKLCNTIYDVDWTDEFNFSISTCSLCLKYYYENMCVECPLFLIDQGCLAVHHDGAISPYYTTIKDGDPKYILEALKKALVYVEENS